MRACTWLYVEAHGLRRMRCAWDDTETELRLLFSAVAVI